MSLSRRGPSRRTRQQQHQQQQKRAPHLFFGHDEDGPVASATGALRLKIYLVIKNIPATLLVSALCCSAPPLPVDRKLLFIIVLFDDEKEATAPVTGDRGPATGAFFVKKKTISPKATKTSCRFARMRMYFISPLGLTSLTTPRAFKARCRIASA